MSIKYRFIDTVACYVATIDILRQCVDIIFEQPYCRITNLVERHIAKRQAGSRYLKELVDIGVLVEQQVGNEKLFIHPKLIRLLTQDGNDFVQY